MLQIRAPLAQRHPRPRPGRSASRPARHTASWCLGLRVRRPCTRGRACLRRRCTGRVGLYALCGFIDLLFAPGGGVEGPAAAGAACQLCRLRLAVAAGGLVGGRDRSDAAHRDRLAARSLGHTRLLLRCPGVPGRRGPGAGLSHSCRHARPGRGPPGGAGLHRRRLPGRRHPGGSRLAAAGLPDRLPLGLVGGPLDAAVERPVQRGRRVLGAASPGA